MGGEVHNSPIATAGPRHYGCAVNQRCVQPTNSACFRHRIVANFAAQSEGVTSDDITRRILETIPKDEKLAA